MQKISPICSNTILGSDPHEWIPRNFEDFLKEMDHIISSCNGNSPLFRGHADSKWLLESSLVRYCKKMILGIEPHNWPSKEIRESAEYYQALLGLLLLKYNILVKSDPRFKVNKILEETHDIDALYDLMKRYQQYPEEDKTTLKGTFFLDWSQKKDVGLFFANFHSNERCVKNRNTDGALFICDKTATNKSLMRQNNNSAIKVEEIIDKMIKAYNEKSEAAGCPLLFHPPKQRLCQRAKNQDAIYWAQMDLRYDLEDVWKSQEEEQYIFIKLILPFESQKECAEHLLTQKITHSYIYATEE